MGLLDAIFSESDRAKRYVKGLLGDPFGVAQQAIGNVADNTRGLLAALRADPNSDASYQGLMALAGAAPVGMTVWHGSPHKFTKFDMSKIGTGEGAQAYGHGLYLAENPKVAQEYSKLNPTATASPNRIFQGVELVPGSPEYHAGTLLERSTLPAARKEVAGWIAGGHPDQKVLDGWKVTLDTLNKAAKKSDFKVGKNENLYKTDIPDEAVARFLDWDKPLSQQAPEVQKAVMRKSDALKKQVIGQQGNPHNADPINSIWDLTGQDLYNAYAGPSKAAGTSSLQDLGIPGIRYLDGGSRSAGQGSSNFVAFDPDMIRILERNGVPTGQQPWKPGEWNPGLLGGM